MTKRKIISLGLILIPVAVYLFVYLVALIRFPLQVSDEGWQISNAWHLLTTGDNSTPIMYPFLKPDLARPFLPDLFLAGSLKIFGPSLLSSRLLIFFFFILILILTFLLAKKLYNHKTGWLAIIIFALSPFVFEMRYARNDLFLTFLILSSLFCLIKYLRENKNIFALFSGFLAVLAYDAHQNAGFFIITLFLILVIFSRKNKGLILFLFAGFLAATYYFFLHIYPNPKLYFETVKFSIFRDHPAPLFSQSFFSILTGEFKRYLFYFYPLGVLEGIFFCLALITAFIRRKKEDLLLILFVLVPLIFFTLFSANKSVRYLWPLFPVFAILIAKMFYDLFREKIKFSGRAFLIGLFTIFILFNLFHIARDFWRIKNCDYRLITKKVEEVVPAGAKIIAMPRYQIDLADKNYDFKSIQILSLYQAQQKKTFNEAMAIEKPNYLLFDEELERFVRESDLPKEKQSGFTGIYFFKPDEFLGFLTEKGKLISENYFPCYQLKIYQINW